MDFQSLRDINNLKKLAADAKKEANGVWNDLGLELKKVKSLKKDDVKAAFDKYYVEYLKNQYLNFEGTVSRKPFWMFALFASLIGFIFSIIPYLASVYLLAILLPCIGIVFGRLRDIKVSIWWIALVIIPFYIGTIILACMLALPCKTNKK